ncbi:hypothetical protein OPKNFCMD_6009 [Methylobacterium crusticola]|uniref:Transposase n=1 Tax=Methylobacterium crusticola TaxID=1697972 RepID=A0ABQ4R743_9HYPH|nr:hypothetical protein OPKNFCMD_6009 [Methylobacterium crusticola]
MPTDLPVRKRPGETSMQLFLSMIKRRIFGANHDVNAKK